MPVRIFLCGGRTTGLPGSTVPPSARADFILAAEATDWTHREHLVLAESVAASFWPTGQPNSDYPFYDLLGMEDIVGACVPLTLLFVESPGSLAELGAFAVLSEISAHLLIVFDPEHRDGFPYLGPVLKVFNEDSERVLFHSLSMPDCQCAGRAQGMSAADLAQVRDTVEEQVERSQATSSGLFDPASKRARVALVLAIVRSFSLVTVSEVYDTLRGASIPDATQRECSRILKVLVALGIIEEHLYSNQTYYWAGSGDVRSPIKWAFKPSAPQRTIDDWQATYSEERMLADSASARKRRRLHCTSSAEPSKAGPISKRYPSPFLCG